MSFKSLNQFQDALKTITKEKHIIGYRFKSNCYDILDIGHNATRFGSFLPTNDSNETDLPKLIVRMMSRKEYHHKRIPKKLKPNHSIIDLNFCAKPILKKNKAQIISHNLLACEIHATPLQNIVRTQLPKVTLSGDKHISSIHRFSFRGEPNILG